ncbi:hypothetical protein BDV12DRAFT_193568 [Aspergillus spectabilis]
MSNHPIPPAPPYWGPSNYTQQWTPQPSASGSMPPNPHYTSDPSSNPQYYNFESFYANSNLPGLGGAGATGTFPPPFALPGGFPPAAAPPSFAPLPNMGYPLMPLPPAPSHPPAIQPSPNDITHSTHSNASGSRPLTTTSSKQDLDREEGELTDFEGPETRERQPKSKPSTRRSQDGTFSQKSRKAGGARNKVTQMEHSQSMVPNGLHSKNNRNSTTVAPNRRESLSSELEEGEASPEPRASTRDSGSPYNPPMPLTDESPFAPKSFPEAASESIGALNAPHLTSTESQASPGAGMSLAQLRVQAQGALLSLAPHSIRYGELVGEGINPMILRQLYEEVGIKVPTMPADVSPRAGSSENAHSTTSQSAAGGQAEQPTQQPEPQNSATPKSAIVDRSATPLQPTQANTAKPMERKEVIARMLAAKAAKSSPTSATPQTDTLRAAPPSQSLPEPSEISVTFSPSRDLSPNAKELRVKEKNKAQTELARQRIEQLKKQGLVRSLQKTQPDNQILDKEERLAAQQPPQAPTSTIVQHPLPERPPVPESTSLEQIPGLFMADQVLEQTDGAPVTSTQDNTTESATHFRASHRKRPRASDFDEPIPVPKRALSNGMMHAPSERLVIDISDDEFYDDEDVSMYAELTSTDPSRSSGTSNADLLSRAYLSPVEGLPHRPATSQSHGFSTTSTPNNFKNGEQEDLRRKDLEIQAMHRRIAELEQRKKAKLASRTQSPRTSDLSPPDLVSMPIPTTPHTAEKIAENILAPMGVDVLRGLKVKLLRLQEIEAGVPSLDAEIRKSETKLANIQREEEKLSSELAKGKEGRRQLLEELNSLKSELNGLSLDQVNTVLISLEAQKELPVEAVQGMLRRLSIPGLQHSNTTTYNDYAIAPSSENEASVETEVPEPNVLVQNDTLLTQPPMPAASHSPFAEHLPPVPNNAGDTSTSNAHVEEPTDTSMSEDSSSSMDESSDDSSSSSGSLNEEMLDAQDLDTNSTAPAETTATTGRSSGLADDEADSEIEPSIAAPHTDLGISAGEDFAAEPENLTSRVSPVSEAYEPPEPEESASASSDSSYSPAPSPDIPSPASIMEISGSSQDQTQEAGEPLTERVQELDIQQPNQYTQIGLLDNTRSPEDSQRKFSPYTSPLKMFKAYRFHPNYSANVSGGYRSLTYSHDIDPLKYLCPFEISGGVCNDRSCEFQHFRDMTLSDDKILVQMGSLREGKTVEESDQYVAGLKESINDMRRDKVKDMNTVASEIAAYRRRFLQDPTRVLAL